MASELSRKSKVSAMAEGEAALVGSTDAGNCAHCGDSLAGLKIVRRSLGSSERAFCCNGCAFIAEQLFLAQAGARDREALGVALVPPAGGAPATGQSRAQIPIQGMVCAACARLVEHQLRGLQGVVQAHVDFSAQRAFVIYDEKQVGRDEFLRAITSAGYVAGRAANDDRKRARTELLRVGLAWLMMMQVMMLAVPFYLAEPGEVPADVLQLMRIASLILTLPVVLYSAQPLLRAAMSQLRTGVVGMDLPVVLGLGVAFVASAGATFLGRGAIYFDSITMFIALILGSRWLLVRGLASAREHVDALRRSSVLSARRLVAFPSSLATESIAAPALRVGDRVLVPPGETVPADGVVVHGRSSASQAWLTGESHPIEKSAGAPVLAGSVNLDQPLVIEVTRRGEATSLAALQRLVEDAGGDRPAAVELANRIAGGFLWFVLAVTVATAIGWSIVDPSRALAAAIAVLVVSCPCALALAAPTAIAAAQSALAQRRILLARTSALETLARVDILACDKTGTLTTEEPALLKQMLLRDADPDTVMGVAAAMETMSTHPYARALVLVAQTGSINLPPLVDGRVEASAGIEATIGGKRYRLGKVEFALPGKATPARNLVAGVVAREALSSSSYIVLADDEGPVALFAFGERLRDDAHALVDDAADHGVETVILSGDRREPVQAVASALGVERRLAHQTPESKRGWVIGQQRAGHKVAMLGDGINDAPVIAQADVSIALASGSTLAQARADLIVLSSRLSDVRFALATARRTLAIVRQNFAWAIIYNVVAVPAAALGWVSPGLAAVGMAVSSLVVVGNALRAKHVRMPVDPAE